MNGTVFPPIVTLALGAAFSFYGFRAIASSGAGGIGRAAGWILIAAAAFCGILVTWAEKRVARILIPGSARDCRAAARALLFFAIGVSVALASFARHSAYPAFGLSPGSVRTISALVAEDPLRLESGSVLLQVELLAAEDADGRLASATGRVPAFLSPTAVLKGIVPGRGSSVAMDGILREGQRGTTFSARSIRVVGEPGRAARLRNRIIDRAVDRFRKVAWGGLASALLLGKKDGLESGEGELYAQAGCAHVLALSGMHLAVISAIVAFALKGPLGIRAAAAIGTVTVFAYVSLIGPQPALVRSAAMYALGALAVLRGYTRRIIPLLSVAFLLQLIADGVAAQKLSFAFSYLALIGIAVLGSRLNDLVAGSIPRSLAMPLTTSVGAFIATSAVCAAAFGALRPIGIAATLIVAPAATAVMIGGLAWFALDVLIPPVAAAFAPVVAVAAAVCERTVSLAARAPGFDGASPTAVFSASLAAAGLLVYGRYRSNEKRNRIAPFD